MKNTKVTGYVCPADVEYCDASNALFANETVTDNTGHFTLYIDAYLEKGKSYKVSVITEKGYAETTIYT
jgi:flagellar biosynthesis/type III secretory pathway protein FliH